LARIVQGETKEFAHVEGVVLWEAVRHFAELERIIKIFQKHMLI
jgi:hypothetical protein